MNLRVVYIFIFLFIAFPGGAYLNVLPPGNITVEIHSSRSSPTIGDSLSVFCTVTAPDDVRVSEPNPGSTSTFIDIEKIWDKKESLDSGITREQFGYLLYVLTPDTLSVGPFTVGYVTAEGDTGTVSSNIITLLIKSVIENPESPPMPNRSPFGIPSQGIPLWLVILLIIILIVVIAWLVYYFRMKKTAFLPHAPPEPIDEIAVFEHIRSLRLHEKGEFKRLYILISNAMRGFIHRNMNFDALYRTSEEIINGLSLNSVDGAILNPIQKVLVESDMVKFAKYIPPAHLSSTIIDRTLDPVKAVLEKIEREKMDLSTEQESAVIHKDRYEFCNENTSQQSGGNH